MANITITLLTNKRTRQTIDGLDSVVAAQAGGYNVVEGENKATEIAVNYPEPFAAKNCYVYMKNARGEYDTHQFTTLAQTKHFTLPSTMTYRGNTILVFHAIDGDINTVWLPVIVPIGATGIDYHKVATANEDFLKEVLDISGEAVRICREIEGKANAGGFNGQSVFIRFSAKSDGSGMTETWQQGQRYMGTMLGIAASSSPADYDWAQFVGDAFCSTSAASGAVTLELQHDTDRTYTSGAISKLKIVIPADAGHGFYAGVNFRTGAKPPTIEWENRTKLPLKLLERCLPSDGYAFNSNSSAQIIVTCDGLNVYSNLLEV